MPLKKENPSFEAQAVPTVYDLATSMENNCGRRMCELRILRDWCESLKNVFGGNERMRSYEKMTACKECPFPSSNSFI